MPQPSAAADPELGDSASQAERLRAFLRWLAPVLYGFGLVEAAVFLLTGEHRSGWTAAVALGYGAVLIWSWRAFKRGGSTRAVTAIWLGMILAAVATALVQPAVYAAVSIVPLLAVAVALPFERGRNLVRVLLVAWAAIALITVAGILLPDEAPLPAWFLDSFRIAAGIAASGLVLLLLGQFSDRLTGALAESERAVAALRATQTQLEEEWEQLEIILRSIGDAVIATDGASRIVFLNPVAEDLTGWDAEEAIGRPFGEVFVARASRGGDPLDDVTARVLRTGRAVALAPGSTLIHRDGLERAIADSAAPIHDATGGTVGAVVVFRDVTRDEEAEAERRRIERRIREAQKLESLGMLAGGVAHDFNNLLVAILGNASLARADLPEDSPARESLEQIETASRRAADLARQMLAYSGRGRFDVQAVDVNAVVGEVADLLRASIPKGARIELELAPGLPAIEADATQLRQVVMNLVINAGEAIGDADGRIVVRTLLVDADEAYLAETVLDDELPAGRYLGLEVADTGTGMDPATRGRIFDPFFSTKFTGRGLGLAAVLGIVRGHQGAIQVYSEPDGGSRFRVLLPIRGEAEPSPPPAPAASTRRDWKARGTVLVIDDEPGVRAVAGAMLRRAGLEVVSAADGVEGVAVFRERANAIDVVLLDLTMPRMGGAETFEAIREIRPDARVILTSGFSEEEAGSRFVGRGLAGFIQKPFTADDLASAIAAALENRPEPTPPAG